MGNGMIWIIFAVMCVIGGGSSIFVALGIPAVILWKIWRAVFHHISLMD